MNDYTTGRAANVDPEDVRAVRTLDDLVRVLELVRQDFSRWGEREWENGSLDRFLCALAALARSLPQMYANEGQELSEEPTWAVVARLIVGATGYE